MMNNSQGASSFFSGLSTLLGRPHPLLHNLSDTTKDRFPGAQRVEVRPASLREVFVALARERLGADEITEVK